MEQKPKNPNGSIILEIWGDYEFTLYPGSAKTKPYVEFYFLNPLTGKEERQRKLTGLKPGSSWATLKKDAKILVESLKELLSKGYDPINNTFNELPITPLSPIIDCLNYWYKERETKVKNDAMTPKTLKMNGYLLQFFTKWLTEKKSLYRKPDSFTKIDIDNFLEATAKERKWGKVSYNCYRTDLGTFFLYLKTLKIVTDNPVEGSIKKNTKSDSSRFAIWEINELSEVVKLLASDKRYLGLYIASKMVFHYNLRPVELTRLQVYNIDFEKRLITLEPTKTKNGNEAIFILNDEMFNLLDDLVANAPAENYVFGRRSKTSKRPVDKHYLGQKFNIFREEYNISPKLKFYALKHSSNYFDIEAGASYEEIRQRNRHGNLQVTTAYIRERLFKNKIKPSGSLLFN